MTRITLMEKITEKFKDTYRILSARLKDYDYGQDGAYFVTTCTKNREHFFGKIVDEKMCLSEIGKIAQRCWKEIPQHFPFVELGEWVVMPNHVHGVLFFDKSVETQNFASLRRHEGNAFGPQSMNLASVVRGFKIGVTKYARQDIAVHTVWQPRFYDRIIRSDKELNRISEYITNNVKDWEKDDYFL